MSIDAVIFDMDGVLVDSESCWYRAAVDFARDAGKTWTEHDHHACMGNAPEEWARYMRERMNLSLSLQDITARVTRGVHAQYEVQLPLLPGAVQAVRAAACSYRVALASGSPSELVDHVMELTGLDKVFQAIVAGNAVKRGKPAPDIYLEAARRIGIIPTRCVGLEDSLNGIRSLKAACMLVIAVPSPSYPLPQEALDAADAALPSLRDFSVELVQSLGSGEV
jgi:mannitol-1-/sugar-/sorbitol-6-/2-deoxyglucose-6-phosphatase